MHELEQNPWLLLEGRIAFRKRWALAGAPPLPKPPSAKQLQWEIDYDEEHNFAHIGARFVDDDWGKPIPKKLRTPRRSEKPKTSFVAEARKLLAASQ